MLGDFITGILVMILGYLYPAFECYKTLEKNRVEIEELRFWCQYWILVAMLSVLERMGDIFISWVPMYGELKLAFVIYLWYPKTKGTGYIYETLLRPLVGKYEPDIDKKLLEWRARAWDFAIYYWQNCTNVGQTTFFQILKYLIAQSSRFTSSSNEKGNDQNSSPSPGSPLFNQSSRATKWPPTAPPPPSSTINRSTSEPTKPDTTKLHPHRHTEALHFENTSIPEFGSLKTPEAHNSDKRTWLRRSKQTHK